MASVILNEINQFSNTTLKELFETFGGLFVTSTRNFVNSNSADYIEGQLLLRFSINNCFPSYGEGTNRDYA